MHMYMYMYMHNNYNSTHVHIHACTYMCIQVWVQARYIICDICGSCKQVGAAYIGYLGLSCFPLLALHLYNALSLSQLTLSLIELWTGQPFPILLKPFID